jgi:hypothetical protein
LEISPFFFGRGYRLIFHLKPGVDVECKSAVEYLGCDHDVVGFVGKVPVDLRWKILEYFEGFGPSILSKLGQGVA